MAVSCSYISNYPETKLYTHTVYYTDNSNYGNLPLRLNDCETVLSRKLNTYRHKHTIADLDEILSACEKLGNNCWAFFSLLLFQLHNYNLHYFISREVFCMDTLYLVLALLALVKKGAEVPRLKAASHLISVKYHI